MLDKVVAATAGSWWSRGKRKENDNGRKTREILVFLQVWPPISSC